MIYLQCSLIYQMEYVFPSKTKNVYVKVFNIITRINKLKSLKNLFDVTVHVASMLKNVIQTKKME